MAACCNIAAAVLLTILVCCPCLLRSELNLPIQQIESWATNFGYSLYELCRDATALEEFQTSYLLKSTKVEQVDGNKLAKEMKHDIEEMLDKKVKAVKSLVKVAQEAYANHENRVGIELKYPKSKKLNLTEFHLEEDEHFNYIPVNLNQSTVHVPTDVYDESDEILNGVAWSAKLDEHFTKNYIADPTLTWQYFASVSGFFRNYPGIQWPKTDVDLFDCRARGWYIQAATSAKDIVILLDASGSMLGLRMEIAKAAVRKIVDTLSDDDFFNIITFSKNPAYLDECFNDSLVQANADNKKKLLDSLQTVKTQDIANFDLALREGFELLHSVKQAGQCSQCNQAIMLITDGAPETYEEVFEKYNRPEVKIRIFTFMIGREVGDAKQVKWMACANRGFYSHISTLADVHEHIQDYVHVLSRPMVIMRADHTTWTSVYFDAAGLLLTTSVGQPVFDISNDTEKQGILVGVMGTDVPIKELTKLTPHYKMGVNGYAFAITNNGYIIFHPDFRPTKDGKMPKPNYNSVDLAEVELSEDENEVHRLRNSMVDRKTGSMKMKVKIHYDDMKRVTIREQNYYYTDIKNTPFSIGIALPTGYGMNHLKGQIKLKNADLMSLGTDHVKLAPWNYCKMDTNETKQNLMEMLIKYLQYGQQVGTEKANIYRDRCDEQLIEGLLFDAHVTKDALVNWIKMNHDTTSNSKSPPKNGIEMVFIGTKSGLTRYYTLVENVTDRHFVYEQNGTIEELYYKRAVENGEVFTFSVPFKTGEQESWNDTLITASMPIVLAHDDNEAVAAVVGLQMRFHHFYELLMKMTRSHDKNAPNNTRFTCESPELDCFLLDNNGFVVLSENHDHVGTFFGEIDGALMEALIIDENDRKSSPRKGVFEKVNVSDFQSVCEIWKSTSSAASRLIFNPIRGLFWTLVGLAQEIAFFTLQFSLYTWWQGGSVSAYAYTDTSDTDSNEVVDKLISKTLDKLADRYNSDVVYKWGIELVHSGIDYHNPEVLEEWSRQKYEQATAGQKACVKEQSLYMSRASRLPSSGTLTHCPACNRSYTIHRVFKTNLMLLAVDANCQCSSTSMKNISIRGDEIIPNSTCQRLQAEAYRQRPHDCFSYYEQEDSSDCGRCSVLYCSVKILITSLLLVFLLNQH